MTSQKTGPEAIEEAAANTLAAFLLGEMNALWTAWGDSATTPEVQPPQVFPGRRYLIPEYPAMMVVHLDSMITEPGDITWQGWLHRLEVVTVVASDDVHVMDMMSKRIMWATVKALAKHQKLDGSVPGVVSVLTRQTGRSRVLTKDQMAQMMQYAGVQFDVQTDELI
jgi:hypothetical protein